MGRFRPGRNSGAARNRARCSGCSCLTWSMLSIDWSWTAGILGHASSLLAGEPAAREGEYVNLFLRVLEQEFRQRQQGYKHDLVVFDWKRHLGQSLEHAFARCRGCP